MSHSFGGPIESGPYSRAESREFRLSFAAAARPDADSVYPLQQFLHRRLDLGIHPG